MNIRQYFGFKVMRGDVGLELEVEFPRRLQWNPPADTIWEAKADGSLRLNGMEFVSKGAQPLNLETRDKLSDLCAFLREHNALENSPRTSFHVHVNVREKTPIQVWNAVFAYWLIEPLLMEYCGADRKGSLYCLQIKLAEALLDDVTQEVSSGSIFGFGADNCKYSGVNLSAVINYGSLEFRGMRGTIDANVLWTWTEGVYTLVKNAAGFSSPVAIMDYYNENGPDALLSRLLYGCALYDEAIKIPDRDDQILDNFVLIAPTAYSVDFDQYTKKAGADENKPKARIAAANRPRAGEAAWIVAGIQQEQDA